MATSRRHAGQLRRCRPVGDLPGRARSGQHADARCGGVHHCGPAAVAADPSPTLLDQGGAGADRRRGRAYRGRGCRPGPHGQRPVRDGVRRAAATNRRPDACRDRGGLTAVPGTSIDLGLAQTSDRLLFWAVLAYAVSMVGYAAEFAFDRRSARAVDAAAGLSRSRRAGVVAVALTVAGWALHVGSVTTRGMSVHRVPWGNMYEFSSMVSLVAVTVFLVLLTRQQVRFLGLFVMAPVVLYLGLAGTVLYANAGPLVPALNSYWIKIHVVAAITASGAFMVSGVVTVLYLLKERWERRTLSLGPGAAAVVEVGTPPTEEIPVRQRGLLAWLPEAARLDRLAY